MNNKQIYYHHNHFLLLVIKIIQKICKKLYILFNIFDFYYHYLKISFIINFNT